MAPALRRNGNDEALTGAFSPQVGARAADSAAVVRPEPPVPTPTARRPSPSLRAQLLRRLAVVALVPAALLGLAVLVTSYVSERRNLVDRLTIATNLSASGVDDYLQTHLAAVALLAHSAPDHADWPAVLADMHEQYPAAITLLRTDAAGRVLASYPPSNRPHRDVADREYFRLPARTGRAHVSDAFVGRGYGHDPLVAVSAPILRAGRFAGVVEASIHVDAFTRVWSSTLRGRGYETLILDRDDRVVHASAGLPFAFEQSLRGAAFLEAAASTTRPHVDGVLRGGGGAYVARAPMHSGWTLLLFARDESLAAALRERLGAVFAMLALAAIGAALAVRLEMRRFAGSLARVLAPLESLARGGRAQTAPIDGVPVELTPLAHAIDELAGRLDHARQDNAELDRLSRTDALTGVLNRRGIDDELARRRARTQAGLDGRVAVVAFDVDRFKAFNDRYGHVTGDTALRRVAAALAGSLRGAGDVLGRTGGEEFIALLPEADVQAACAVAERARRAVEALGIPHADAPGGRLTVSGGVALAADAADGHPLEDADAALYRAKHAGRNRIAR